MSSTASGTALLQLKQRLSGARFLSTSAVLLAARMVGAGAGFCAQLILAKFLLPEELGVYFTATSLVVVGGVVAAHGYPSIAIRFVSRYRGPHGGTFLSRFIHHAQAETLVLALALAAAVAVGAGLWPSLDGSTRVAFLLAAATIPFVAGFRLYGALAMANRAFRLAFLPDVSLKPLILLVALGAILLLEGDVGLVEVMLALTVITVALSLAQRFLLARRFPAGLRGLRRNRRRRPAFKSMRAQWRREAHAVLLVAIFTLFLPELSILLATPILNAADIGTFGLCLKLAFLAGFFVLLTQNLATPDLADALGKGGEARIPAKLVASSSAATLASLAGTLACLQWGDNLLRLFGPDFEAGHRALVMLFATQLVRAVFGPTNAVLTLVGAQRTNLVLTAAALAVLAGGMLVLGTWLGLDGAAAAVLITVLFWSGSSAWMLHRKSGVRVDLLSGLAAWRAEAAGSAPLSPARQPGGGEAAPAG